ncbi:Uncharacterized protein TCM_008161 [Theobroma cacao]|uniref:Uncharacterized protein n=1 Tax=Theobroma cacao TaxID=3641 RepID=A0A061E552_THECC|nr:Uncharacterized protein TCM_008161 [Theobroma cacao]
MHACIYHIFIYMQPSHVYSNKEEPCSVVSFVGKGINLYFKKRKKSINFSKILVFFPNLFWFGSKRIERYGTPIGSKGKCTRMQ